MTKRTTGAAQAAAVPARRKSTSGSILTEERRRELGYGSIKLRLPLDVLAMLQAESDESGYSRAELVDAAIRLYVGDGELARSLQIRKKPPHKRAG